MSDSHSDLAGLAQLHRLGNEDEVRALWRRGLATLARQAIEHQPVPLEGFHPSALLSGVRIALHRGLMDDLSWLSAPAAAVAIFELASALPRSEEKRILGRQVLHTLRHGDAETFVALATSLALGSSRVLSGTRVRAQVALSLDLPIGLGLRADALALALISRRESEEAWLGRPSTGSLPSRRLAARLLERAAREAARRAAVGDDNGVRVFRMSSVHAAMERLLADRESLVWRHAAAARGLLSAAVPAWKAQIEDGLSAELTPTEWRRASASLAARIAVDPEATLAQCREVLRSNIVVFDNGIVAAMILGLPCAADAELDAAEELLDTLVRAGDLQTVEALVDLRRERIGSDFGAQVAARARVALLRAHTGGDDAGRGVLRAALAEELTPPQERRAYSLHGHLVTALEAFARGGDPGPATEAALGAATEAMARLERTDAAREAGAGDHSVDDYRETFEALRELDRGLLETSTLRDLLVMHGPGSRSAAEFLMGRLARWLLAHESQPLGIHNIDAVQRHITWRMSRLRALLHLVDAEPLSEDRRGDGRAWRLQAMKVLRKRVREDTPSPLRRAVCAALARACDAVVREELGELSDVLVAVTTGIPGESELAVLAEASMDPVFKTTMRAYVEAVRQVAMAIDEPPLPPGQPSPCLEALRDVALGMPPSAAPRVEALRSAFLRVVRALATLDAARGLDEIAGNNTGSAMSEFIASITWIIRLSVGARRRLGSNSELVASSSLGEVLRSVDAAFERAVRGDRTDLGKTLRAAVQAMRATLTPLLADVSALVFERIARLPVTAPVGHSRAADEDGEPVHPPGPMVPWLPPGRVLGGFYILRTIGKGAVGSVFVTCRVDQRHDENAERFALKVPEYAGDAAHILSQAEFLRLFREEARALLGLPEHPNLARFVTFDAGVRPKPILVMELVEGPTLARVLDREEMSVAEALAILDGIAAGLAAMHQAGVAHLDVKPSNIILREQSGGESLVEGPKTVPVLVDFGLAGRQVRPGCATVYYGAPEVWAAEQHGKLLPMPTDVYAFSCLAFEMLTGQFLFDGETAAAIINSHLAHDGVPERLREYICMPELAPLMELLSAGLRPRSQERASIETMRAGLVELASPLANLLWPLGARVVIE